MKKRKLLVQVGLMIAFVFVTRYLFSLVLSYQLTQFSFLSSKQEWMDADLLRLSSTLETMSYSDLVSIIKSWESDDGQSESTESGEATEGYDSSAVVQYLLLSTMDYDDAYFLDVLDEHESIVLPIVDAEGLSYDPKHVSYDASEHKAIRTITAGQLDYGETLYEVYEDPSTHMIYYVGYTPVQTDESDCRVFCLSYEFTEYNDRLRVHVVLRNTLELLALLLMSVLLMQYLYKNAISPIVKVNAAMRRYTANNASDAVVDEMDRIAVRNEVKDIATSFSELVVEIDQHTEEILRLNGERERQEAELSLAANIQLDALPSAFPAFPERPEFDLHASMNAAKEVGGDFYDFFLIDDDHLGLVMADVSGKGISASLFMMSAKTCIGDRALMGGTPAQILRFANKKLATNNTAFMFVTVWLGILQISTGKLIAANAGHEYPAVKRNGTYDLLKDKHGRPLGARATSEYTDYEIELGEGDGIFLYTDGVAEANDPDGELFGTDRMISALNAHPDAAPPETLTSMLASINEFAQDAPQFDDITMLCLTYHGCKE